jgi:hypothetical protein
VIEYAFRKPGGELVVKDEDGELMAPPVEDPDLYSYVRAVDPSPEQLDRIKGQARRQGWKVMSRELGEFEPIAEPLPTTPASVVELEGRPYVRVTEGDSAFADPGMVWRPVDSSRTTARRTDAQMAGARVLFDAGAAS